MKSQFLVSLLFWLPSLSAAQCLGNYTFNGTTCVANKPSAEFFYGSLNAAIPSDQYPICGAGRVPVTGDGSYSWSNMASSGVPRSAETYSSGTTYRYLKNSSAPPVYAYEDLSRCVCINQTIPETPAVAAGTGYQYLGPITGSQRVLPDTMEVIYSQTASNQARYGMVAIANDESSDGRLGALYSTSKSKCGCPNFNEVPVPVDPGASAGDPVGVRCEPAIAPHPARVLTLFNPAFHDQGASTQVLDRGNEIPLNGSPGALVSKISLPKTLANQTQLESYARRIWVCAQPYQLNLSTKSCEFVPDAHSCDVGDPGRKIPPSEMHPKVTGSSKQEAFENAVNKKLGACLNEFGSVGSTVKFDCLDNSWQNLASFNELWAGVDPDADGGQPYAIEFYNPAGRNLTGFFKLTGERCAQYSEFGGDLIPGRLSKATGSWVFTPQGGPLPVAPSSAPGAGFRYQKISAMGKRVPQTPAEKAECPVLARAAIVVTCPQNPVLPGAQKTLDIRNASNVLTQRRCSVASNVQVQVRIEQIYEIEGQAPMRPFDTFAEKNHVAAIPVSQITAAKYGSTCPPGTLNRNDGCSY